MNNLDKALQAITDHKKELVAVVVHLNDTYQIDDRPERKLPGFAKIVATIEQLREHIEKETEKDLLLVVHSGDFLSPSLVGNYKDKQGKYDHGQTMVKLLNAARVNYCVLGNHEFDYGAEVLADRLREADFKVLLANTTDKTELIKQEHPSAPKPHIKMGRYVVWPEGDSPPRIALTGVVSADVHKSFVSPHPTERDAKGKRKKVEWKFTPPNEAVIQAWNDIKDDEDDKSTTGVAFTTNIPFRFVLTHGTQIDDNQLRRQITETPRTYILGGHDHHIGHVDYVEKIYIGKNLANAETMRVILPLAGGISIFNEVYAAYARLQERRPDEVLRYPEDLEAVLLTASDLDREVLRDRIEKATPDGGFRNLEDALNAAKSDRDIPALVLSYDDHTQVDADADRIIQKALKKVEQPNDDDEVCDFTGTIAKFEARDGYIRLEPTNMGVFVAQCVRLKAKESRPANDRDPVVAIVNSGAFRCDSELKPKLKVRDLRETFLFDEKDAIMVLKVSAEVVDKLIEHGTGQTKLGTGAFPQIAGHEEGAPGEVWLAISSFLLTRSDNNDGYDAVLHEFWGSPPPKGKGLLDLAATQEEARNASVAWFSIIDAVKKKAKAVEAAPPEEMLITREEKAVEGTDEIFQLLRTYLETFDKEMSPHDKENFQAWLGTDEPIPQRPAMQKARDKVRKFLKELPAVVAYSKVAAHSNKDSQWKDDSRKAWNDAKEELLALQKSLLHKDDLTLREGDGYGWLFDLAARDIPGWGDLPPFI
jgi:2',3'-cyclic-nucleotide 2'-phosphodiesterase (5'-nucleotidase family)